MKDLDKMLREARQLEILSRPYNRVSVIEKDDKNWIIRGCSNKFKSLCAATQYCREAAAGRDYVVIINDLPQPSEEDIKKLDSQNYAVFMSVGDAENIIMQENKEVGLWHDSE